MLIPVCRPVLHDALVSGGVMKIDPHCCLCPQLWVIMFENQFLDISVDSFFTFEK